MTDNQAYQKYNFAECRGMFGIPDGFSDSNYIETDGPLENLPKLSFHRHGAKSQTVSDCHFRIATSATGAIKFTVASSGCTVVLGAHTRMMLDLRMWRSSNVEVQEFTTINSARFVVDNSDISVGRDCMFSDEVLVQSTDQHGIWDLESNSLTNSGRRHVEIGEHVWVGRRTVIMPDSVVGEGSVLGTGSVVTGTIAPCSIAVGIPARSVRSGRSWSRNPTSQNAREKEFFARNNMRNSSNVASR